MEQIRTGTYKGWKVETVKNRWLTLHVAPQLGGRIMQVGMDGYEFLFNHPMLVGKEPDCTRLGENGAWLNFGGEKIWPAPQGWNSPEQWPGPPDPVLDSGIHSLVENTRSDDGETLTLLSPFDPYTGLQIKRNIRLYSAMSGVAITVSFRNMGEIVKRWSVWPVCQISIPSDESNGQHRIVCPVNPGSRYFNGYKVMHGLVNNPQFNSDIYGNLAVDYQYLVGKVGLDSNQGWIAYINKKNGKVFVLRFFYDEGQAYPDDTSVQVWTQGKGLIYSRNKIIEYKDDPSQNPPYMEMELLSPIHEIEPGSVYEYDYQIYTCTIPGCLAIQTICRYGVISASLRVEEREEMIWVHAKYGFFTEGILKIQMKDSLEESLFCKEIMVSPLNGIDLDSVVKPSDGWNGREICCTAEFLDKEGHCLWEIDQVKYKLHEQ